MWFKTFFLLASLGSNRRWLPSSESLGIYSCTFGLVVLNVVHIIFFLLASLGSNRRCPQSLSCSVFHRPHREQIQYCGCKGVIVEDTYIVSPCKNSIYDKRFSWDFLSKKLATSLVVKLEAWRCSNLFLHQEATPSASRNALVTQTRRLFLLRYRGRRVSLE